MKELIEKISSYNIFNYLFPGTLFAILSKNFTKVDITQTDLLHAAFLYYFIGLVISRIGSLIVSPVLTLLRIKPQNTEYSDYIEACATDEKIDLLSEVNNMYRTLCSMVLCIILVKVLETCGLDLSNQKGSDLIWGSLIFLFVLFVFSYRKQSNFIISRVNKHTSK